MSEIMTVFRFTLRQNIRKKSFLITTIIMLVIILVGCLLPSLLGGSGSNAGAGSGGSGGTGTVAQSSACYVVDPDNLLPGIVDQLSANFLNIRFVQGDQSGVPGYTDTIRTDSSVFLLVILPGPTALPDLQFTVTNFMSGAPTGAIQEYIRTLVVQQTLATAGVSADTTSMVLTDIVSTTAYAGKMDVSGFAVGVVLMVVVFFAVYFYGYGVAMSIASEKTSRVMETLVVSTKPGRLLIGKCLAMGALGLIQLLIFLLAAFLGFKFLVPSGFTIMGMPLALSAFTPGSAILILLYFLLGYALFSMLNSICGATVSQAEDLQSAMMPAMIVSVVSFYLSYVAAFAPVGALKQVASYVPLTAPFLMPFRLLNDTVSAGEVIGSIALLLAAVALVAFISSKVYAASVLHYGGRLRLRELRRLAK